MEKRKPGIYCQWFEVDGMNKNGRRCKFIIYYHQAKNYAQAVRFWRKTWGDACTAFALYNATPAPEGLAKAC